MNFKLFRVLTASAALLATVNGFAQPTTPQSKPIVAHSPEEYDQLKTAGHEVVMDMSTYSTKKITPKVWSAEELEEQETAKLFGGGNSDDCNCLKAIDYTYSI